MRTMPLTLNRHHDRNDETAEMVLESATFMRNPKALDLYIGLDEDGGGLYIVSVSALAWACELVAKHSNNTQYKVEYDDSMLKDEVSLCIGFQYELDLKRYKGTAEELEKICVEMWNKYIDGMVEVIKSNRDEVANYTSLKEIEKLREDELQTIRANLYDTTEEADYPHDLESGNAYAPNLDSNLAIKD